jgi:hypothetical protein
MTSACNGSIGLVVDDLLARLQLLAAFIATMTGEMVDEIVL